MSRYKFKFKLGKMEGLEIEIEGDRQDVHAAQKLLDKLTSSSRPGELLQISTEDGADKSSKLLLEGNSTVPAASATRTRRTGRRSAASKTTVETTNPLPSWSHDSDKLGFPRDGWTTAQKGMWLLRVLGQENAGDSFSSADLANIFNSHYKEAGTVLKHNMTRDLDKEKANKKVGFADGKYFLTTSGKQDADTLVEEGKQ